MRHRLALSLAAATLVLSACGDDRPELSPLCTEGEATLTRALARAPAPVRLADGTALSACVAAARDIGELQSFGVIMTTVADRLAGRAARDRRAALRLGYLIGAARKGAAHSEGVPNELVHRLEVSARRLPDGADAQLQRGIRAGTSDG